MTPLIDTPTILIVDDTPSNLGVVVDLFESRGYRVAIAQDGEEGMQRAQLVQPDLILLDVMMPGIDGFETCRRLKSLESTRDIPVILMTALAATEHKVNGFGAGAVDYVTKPLQIDEIMARVDTHLKLSSAQKKLAEHNEALERRVAERTMELAAREREFRTLVENAPDEIARHDRQGRFIYINPQHERTLGIPLANLIGKTHVECFPGIPDVVAYQELLMEVIETGRTVEYEATLPDVGDGPRYHSILLVAERGADGGIVGALAIGRDITELKRADAAVRERELRYRQLFENSPISIWEEDFSAVHSYFDELRQAGVEDLDAYFDTYPEAVRHCAELVRIVDVNQAAVALHHAQSKAELFVGLKQTFTPDSSRAFREELLGLWRGATEMMQDAMIQTLAGESKHVAVQFSIAPDTGEPWSRMLVSLVDITERKQAEQQLAMLGAAIAKMHEAAYFVDDEARIFYVNDAASHQLGYSHDEFLGMTVMDIAPGWTKDMVVKAWQGLGESAAITFEAEHRRKDGGIVPVEINVTHLMHDGKAFGLAMVRDITERNRAERELHLLNRALDNAFDATYLIGEDLRLRYVNEATVRSLGYSREELLSMTLLDIDPNVTREIMREVMKHTEDVGGASRTIESVHRRKDGTVFPIEVGATIFSYEGEKLHLTTVRDITERKRAERELQLLNLAVNASSEAAFLSDAQGRFVYVNDEACRSLGYSREELLTMTAVDIDPDINGEVLAGLLEAIFSHGAVGSRMESRHRTRDGRIFPIEIAPSPLKQEGENYCLTMVRDITERKRAEEALAAREREFRTLAENIPDIIIRYDRKCRKVYLNTATARLMGIKPEEVLNQTPEETPQKKRALKLDQFSERLRRVLETGEPQEMEVTLRHAEQGMQVHNVRFVAERDEQGEIVGALMVGRDITEMKAIENELMEREQRYREIFDNAVEGMYLLEVTDDGRFRNLDINPALAASTGIPREAMIGQFVDDTVPEEVGKLIVEKYRRCVAVGTTITESIELDLPSGKHYYYSTITPIYYEGYIRRLIGISRDITKLKRVEHELEKSREQLRGLMARSEKVREEERRYIAREVHDELGQVLTGLQLDISMLSYKFGKELPALHEHLQGTLELVNRSLATARNVATTLRPGSLDMGIVSAIEWLVERFSKNTGINCEAHVNDEERDIELGETASIALFRITQESLTNIVRHAQASKVNIVIRQEGDEYLLEIKDNGKGFDTASTKEGSFGLLGIRERVYMLGGKLEIVSKAGSGTVIRVRIPGHNLGGEK